MWMLDRMFISLRGYVPYVCMHVLSVHVLNDRKNVERWSYDLLASR